MVEKIHSDGSVVAAEAFSGFIEENVIVLSLHFNLMGTLLIRLSRREILDYWLRNIQRDLMRK